MRLILLLVVQVALFAQSQPLSLSWTNNMLRVSGPNLPGEFVEIWYLEAFCRSGSTDQAWEKTTIPHQTELVSARPNLIKLRSKVEPDVYLDHEIRAGDGTVEFRVVAKNKGSRFADVQWFQPCMRVDRFTGRKQSDYHERSFIFTEEGLKFLHQLPREEEAIYKGGQVYVPEGVPPQDVNPRPVSKVKPANALIGCVSKDGKWMLATAWSDTQELFQGVIVCLHNDPRIGGLEPGAEKELRGKIYVLPRSEEKLMEAYKSDFEKVKPK